jgi:hypothetical protein
VGFVAKIADFFGGGAVKTIADTVKDYFPPSMSDKEKADLQLLIQKEESSRQERLLVLANEQDKEFNERIKQLEGTASDLKALPIIGPVIIFARGCQRPAWGFATMLIDYQVFSKAWDVSGDEQLKALIFAINLLVLGFLFGERAVQNVTPLLSQYFDKKGRAE